MISIFFVEGLQHLWEVVSDGGMIAMTKKLENFFICHFIGTANEKRTRDVCNKGCIASSIMKRNEYHGSMTESPYVRTS